MTKPTKDPKAATTLALLCIGLWALIPVVAKLGQANLDHHQFLFWSSVVSAIVLRGTVFATSKATELRSWTLFSILFGFGFAVQLERTRSRGFCGPGGLCPYRSSPKKKTNR